MIKLRKKISTLVIKPRSRLIMERLILVRKKRGLKAQGDVLLQAALRAVICNECRSAISDIKTFLQIVPDVTLEERAILENCKTQFHVQYRFKIVALTFDAFSWLVMFLLKLRSKTPMGYKFSGFYTSVYI